MNKDLGESYKVAPKCLKRKSPSRTFPTHRAFLAWRNPVTPHARRGRRVYLVLTTGLRSLATKLSAQPGRPLCAWRLYAFCPASHSVSYHRASLPHGIALVAVVGAVAAPAKISFLAVLSADPLAHGRLGEAPLPSHFQARNLAQGGPQPQSANPDPQPPAQLLVGEWPRGTP
jgi:hypothetical protein